MRQCFTINGKVKDIDIVNAHGRVFRNLVMSDGLYLHTTLDYDKAGQIFKGDLITAVCFIDIPETREERTYVTCTYAGVKVRKRPLKDTQNMKAKTELKKLVDLIAEEHPDWIIEKAWDGVFLKDSENRLVCEVMEHMKEDALEGYDHTRRRDVTGKMTAEKALRWMEGVKHDHEN